ncbi:phosphoethanolamine--lipid A transferase [Lysobacter sp. 5GHs7-4]|uniref:phosphoethanolamine transferase n=1 Tax=Lysobacter sp. 5GHs7-4 TaxID=2904253 RepID=UPI001E3286CE|nr:phosphoethanolamine--lipid A transferase [Lysobacter sp. 5GHs7-4]UHQ23120.1 phosphoethanolamine--lipid A transferase [Lysobacter sp. 5GHs7-4]
MSAIARPQAATQDRTVALLGYRPELSVETLALLASAFFTVFCNGSFFAAVARTGALQGPSGWLTGFSLLAMIAALNMLLLCLVLYRPIAKPVLAVLLLTTAMAVRYMGEYTVYLDTDMIRNILHTDGKESGELISWRLLPSLFLYGVLPSLLLWRVRLKPRPFKRAVLIRVACVIGAVAIACGAALLSFQNLSSLMRNHKELRHLITPGNYVMSLARVGLEDQAGKHRAREPIGQDAKVVGRPAGAKPRLLVIVVGETVRAQNWGLNGYARQTTPELARIGPINFPDMRACGSATEISVPCMFSPWGRGQYDKDRIKHSQSLLHVLEHAGLKTLWRDNQTGCKGVCDGLSFESFEHASQAPYCDAQGCRDEVMLQGLDAELAKRPGDTVVVLHQLGNHGPAYYKRYPPSLKRYTPACETSDLGQCSLPEIVNAYDNAVLATDDFLARTIRLLAQQSGRDTAMIYLSDHGESLGENGLFLHGVPYAIAPQTQLRVPMVMWLSPGFAASRGIDTACLRREAAQPASHDNLFHSVLGLMQVSSSVYDPKRDLFGRCGRPG